MASKIRNPLKRIYIEITNICNLNCNFCPETSRAPEFMKFDFFKNILHESINFTEYLCFHIKGEPLLHPQLENFLDAAGQLNFKVNLTTNGLLINEKADMLLKKKALRQLNISLHCSVDNKNISRNYLDNIFNFLDVYQKNNKIILGLRLWNLNNKNEKIIINNENNLEIFDKLESYFNLNYKISEHLTTNGLKISDNIYLNFAQQFEWPDMNAKDYSLKGFCYGLRDQIGILVDGTVVPCCLDRNGHIALGNLKDSTLYDIINGPRALKIFNGFSERRVVEKLCVRCGYRQRFNL